MPSDHDLARWRLRSQHLAEESRLAGAGDVVASLLGVQAENPGQSAWAVAARTAAQDPADLDAALAEGRVIRTHVLRSTWHYVTAEDLVWLLELTSPRLLANLDRQLATSLSQAERRRAGDRVVKALEVAEGRQLTRPQLADHLAVAGVTVTGFELMLLLADLEMRALICSGAPVGGIHSYALLPDRVPHPRRLDRDEALAELALRYVAGHGPATDRDLAYWATLTVTDVRRGLAAAGDRLDSFEHGGRTYWHAPGEEPPAPPRQPAGHLLQLLDEMYRGYQDSRMVLDAAGAVPRGRERQIGMALVDGQLVAGMKREVTDRRVRFELHPHPSWTDDCLVPLTGSAASYAAFLGREPEVVVVR